MPVVWRCAVLKDRGGWSLAFSGGFGEGETPLPIPNRAVKPLSADGTWPARAWESRTPPVYLIERAAPGRLVVVAAQTVRGRAAWTGSPRDAARDAVRAHAGRITLPSSAISQCGLCATSHGYRSGSRNTPEY